MKIRFIKIRQLPTAKKNRIRVIRFYNSGGPDWMPDSESYLIATGAKRIKMRPGIRKQHQFGNAGRHVSSRLCNMRDGSIQIIPFR